MALPDVPEQVQEPRGRGRGRIAKPAVLYMDEELLDRCSDTPKGAVCDKCMMFLTDVSQCSVLKPAQVSGPKGVCGLFIGGDAMTSKDHPAMKIVPREVAGYEEVGPTRCLSCVYFKSPNACAKVEGEIEANGCCNHWKVK